MSASRRTWSPDSVAPALSSRLAAMYNRPAASARPFRRASWRDTSRPCAS
ncbi:Uncharacterised protein [Bordetella pertussis]|nr:Uncharacterised protein [Bordetella pertussis]